MDLKSFQELRKTAQIILSSSFARRCRYLLVGGDGTGDQWSDDWIFSNVEYKPHKDRKKHVDEYLAYKMRTDHVIHHLRFRSARYDGVRKLLLPDAARGKSLLYLQGDILSLLNKVKTSKVKELVTPHIAVTPEGRLVLSIRIDGTLAETKSVGWVLDFQQVDDFHRVAASARAALDTEDGAFKPLTYDQLETPKSGFAVNEMQLPSGSLHIPLTEGLHTVSFSEYLKRSGITDYTLGVYAWRAGQTIQRVMLLYEDADISVVSHRPWMFFYPTKSKKKEKTTDK